MDVVRLDQVVPFVTKDGSEIRELLAHRNSAIRAQSLAEARIEVGQATAAHHHPITEEIYFITHGKGLMTIDDESQVVVAGDAIAIPPGKIHKLINIGDEQLRLLCCCAPGYEHSDTVIAETASAEPEVQPSESAPVGSHRDDVTASGDDLIGWEDQQSDVGA